MGLPLREGTPGSGDDAWLRRAIALAQGSRDAGRHPFGSLVVLDGKVIAESQSLKSRDRDATGHSEMTALHPPEVLARATLYASTEPCAMCAGGAYWTGVGRLVYGFSERGLKALTGAHNWNPTLDLPCREVFARGQRPIEVIGPHLEAEAAKPREGFWLTTALGAAGLRARPADGPPAQIPGTTPLGSASQ